MAASTAQINSLDQKMTLEVRVDGRPCRNLWGADVSMGVSQVNAQATIHFTSRPSFAEEKKPVEIWAGYGGSTTKIFGGDLTGLVWSYAPGVVSLSCQDLLGRLKSKYAGDPREYNVATPASIIQNLVEAMGIPSSLTHIEGSAWETCTTLPLLIDPGQSLWQYVEELDLVESYATYTDRAGVVRRMALSGNIGVGARFAYSKGYNIISCRRSRTNVGIENYCLALGVNYLGLQIGGVGISEAFADNPFVNDPPRFQGPTVRSNFIEDDARALFVAKMKVALGNRRPEKYELDVIGNPNLSPFDVISITHDAVESGSARCAIDLLQHTIRINGASFKTSITTLGGNIVATEVNLPPIAVIDAKCYQEHDSSGASIIVLIADGSGSYDPDSEDVLTFAWTGAVDAGAITPTTSSAAVYQALITGAATELTLGLTVTDSAGATGTLPLILPLNSTTLLYEPLYLGWSDGRLEATNDGDATWNAFTGASGIANTPHFAVEQGTIWCDHAGQVWATIDDLVTAAVSLGSPGGVSAATCCWIHEIDTTRVWVAYTNGAVYFGTMDWSVPSVVWETRGTLPQTAPVEIREAVGSTGSLRATAGTGYYGSEDGGRTWRLIRDFGVAAVASRMAAGFEQNMVAAAATDPLVAETGVDTTTPGGLANISAETIGWRDPALFAGTPSGALYTSDAAFAALALHADSTGGRPIRDMIRSGGIPGIIYLAVGDSSGADNGLMKWIPGLAAPFFIRKRSTVTLQTVGYGPLRRPVAPVDFVFGTWNVSNTLLDGFWRYTFGVWTYLGRPTGTTQWRWLQVVCSPYNRALWLAYGQPESNFLSYNYTVPFSFSAGKAVMRTGGLTPLWLTTDAGRTWTAVQLPYAGSDTYAGINSIGFQNDSGRWYALGHTYDAGGVNGVSCAWTGSTAAGAFTGLGTSWVTFPWSVSGMGGEILASEFDAPGSGTDGRLAYLSNDGAAWNDGSWVWDLARGFHHPRGPLALVKGGRQFWQANLNGAATPGLAYWGDYRAKDPASNVPPTGVLVRPNDINGDYRYIAATATHLFSSSYVGGQLGWYREPHATWAPSGSVDYAAAEPYQCATDIHAQSMFVGYAKVAVGGTDYCFIVHDGRAFARVELPDASLKTANSNAGGVDKAALMPPFMAIGPIGVPI